MIFKIKFVPRKFLNLGISLAVIGFFVNLIEGYSILIPVLWALSIINVGFYFFISSPKINFHGLKPAVFSFSLDSALIPGLKTKVFPLKIKWPIQLEKADIIFPVILLIIFAPIYLLFLYQIPYQVVSDELLLTGFAKNVSLTPTLLGLIYYLPEPSFIYVTFRFLQNFLGGVNLENMRTIHALSGLAIIIVSYYFFKSIRSSTLFAFTGSLLLGSQHVFLAISRTAVRHNTSILIELLTLIFLLQAMRKKSSFYAYLGGVMGGLSAYNYLGSVTGIIIWTFLFATIALFFKKKYDIAQLTKLFLISLLGLIIAALPIIAAYLKIPAGDPNYNKRQLLIYPEGRHESMIYSPKAKKELDIFKANSVRTLTIFNNNSPDTGFIYQNPGHGFVDPLTGILVWVGFFLLVLKRNKKIEELLIITGFITILVIFSLVVNQPHYSRFQVILPFAIFLTVEAIFLISKRSKQFGKFVFIGIVSTIIIWNITIYSDFIKKGLKEGDLLGTTIRYVEARKNILNHTFLIATSEKSRYFPFYDNWISPHQNESQTVTIFEPEKLQDKNLGNLYTGNFTIFLNSEVWEKAKMNLINIYPNLVIHNMMPNGSKIAIEVK